MAKNELRNLINTVLQCRNAVHNLQSGSLLDELTNKQRREVSTILDVAGLDIWRAVLTIAGVPDDGFRNAETGDQYASVTLSDVYFEAGTAGEALEAIDDEITWMVNTGWFWDAEIKDFA